MALPDLIEIATDLETLDQLYRLKTLMNAYVIKNILLVGKAPNAQVETFVNPNLYRIAAQFYGDPDYWTVIANANNITDPNYTGTIALLIPPKPSVNTGGILPYQ